MRPARKAENPETENPEDNPRGSVSLIV